MAVATLGRTFPRSSTGSPPPPPSTGPVLTAADITYLGAIRMPPGGQVIDTDGAYGSITGRVVGANTHLFVFSKNVSSAVGDLWEIDISSCVPSTDYTTAPRAVVVKQWGQVWGNARTTWDSTGGQKDLLNNRSGHAGLHWNATSSQLYGSYVDFYNVSGSPDWTLWMAQLPSGGSTTGNSSAYGPWRFNAVDRDGSTWGGHRSYFFFEHPVTGKLLCGGVSHSGDHATPWGPSMYGDNDWPQSTTPGGLTGGTAVSSNDILLQSRYLDYYPMNSAKAIASGNYLNLDGTLNGVLRSFEYPSSITYPHEVLHSNVSQTRIDPNVNNGRGSWSGANDGVNDAVWFNGTHKRGVIYVGGLAGGYSTVGSDSAACHAWYLSAGQTACKLGSVVGTPTPGEAVIGQTSTAAGTVGLWNTAAVGSSWLSITQSVGQQPTDYSVGETVKGLTSSFTGTVEIFHRNSSCSHGFPVIGTTGDVTSKRIPVLILADPDTLIANKSNGNDYQTHCDVIDVEKTYRVHVGLVSADASVLQGGGLHGAWLNGTTLYVNSNQADDSTPGVHQTLIHAFSING